MFLRFFFPFSLLIQERHIAGFFVFCIGRRKRSIGKNAAPFETSYRQRWKWPSWKKESIEGRSRKNKMKALAPPFQYWAKPLAPFCISTPHPFLVLPLGNSSPLTPMLSFSHAPLTPADIHLFLFFCILTHFQTKKKTICLLYIFLFINDINHLKSIKKILKKYSKQNVNLNCNIFNFKLRLSIIISLPWEFLFFRQRPLKLFYNRKLFQTFNN